MLNPLSPMLNPLSLNSLSLPHLINPPQFYPM
jgi:hypothetical protein